MLILPLHKKPTLANFPWVTLLLVLVNGFIYFALQAPDNTRQARAVEAYADSRLAEIELPAYRDYVERTPSIAWRERWQRLPEPMRTQVLAMQVQNDTAFLAELRAELQTFDKIRIRNERLAECNQVGLVLIQHLGGQLFRPAERHLLGPHLRQQLHSSGH